MKKSFWIVLLPALFLIACEPVDRLRTGLIHLLEQNHHDHGEDQARHHDEDGHDHDPVGGDHAHHDAEAIVVTHFTDLTELHVEFPPLVVGEPSEFAAHLSRLEDGGPVEEGTLTLSLVGDGVPPERFEVSVSDTPGIFRPVAVPEQAGRRRLELSLSGAGLNTSHSLGEYVVYATHEKAMADLPHEQESQGAIFYSKEQQWQVDFNTVQAQQRKLRASLIATGSIRPRADGEVYLSAASTGHIRSRGRFPYPGMRVEQGQLLASIAPQLAADSDLSTLTAALDKARSSYELAKHERNRLERLWNEKVVALHRLHEADTALQLAKTELEAAERRYRQSTGQKESADSGIPILAPIDGVVVQVETAAGKYVNEGESLFHIVNPDRLWLEARIAEADIGALSQPAGAWFTVSGFGRFFDTDELGGQMIAFGGVVDPVSRTAPLIFEFENPDRRLRAGMFANVRVFNGELMEGIAVPATAIFDDGGQEVVYVQLDGEHFQRQPVRLGVREGGWVQLLGGVEAGDRVVSRGAYLLRLASAAPTEAGHGHAH